MDCFVALLLAMTRGGPSSEKIQILRATALRDHGVFDRQEQSARHIDFSILRRGERLADTNGVLDGCGDVNGCLRIGLAYRGGDGLCIHALVVRRRTDHRVEGRRQRADDLAGLLVNGNADYENPVLSAINRVQARQRLPDAIGGMADVDNRERLPFDNFEAAGPADVAEARSHGGFDFVRCFPWAYTLQPQQEQGDRDGGVVELKCTRQAHFERSILVTSELEIEPLPGGRSGFGADSDLVTDKKRSNRASAIIFDQMRLQVSAILAVNDG